MNPDQHKKTQFSIFYVVVGLLVILGLQWILGGGLATDVAYSDFKRALADGKVQEVVVSPTGHPGRNDRSGGQPLTFHTLRVDEPDLVKQLSDKGVKFTGKQSGSFLGSIISWILPACHHVCPVELLHDAHGRRRTGRAQHRAEQGEAGGRHWRQDGSRSGTWLA